MKRFSVIAAALAALFVCSTVFADSHGSRQERAKQEQSK